MQRFDEHVLLHAEVQSLHCAARRQQRLMGGRLLQLGKSARSGREERKRGVRKRASAFCHQQEPSNTYEKQAQSQVRGVPQSIPPPPPRLPPAPTVLPPRSVLHRRSCRAERRLYRASLLSGRWKTRSWCGEPAGAFLRQQHPQGEPALSSEEQGRCLTTDLSGGTEARGAG